MKITRCAAFAVALTLALSAAPAFAADEDIARYGSNVVSTNLRQSTVLDIRVQEWSTDNDRVVLHEAFKVGGNPQMYKLLHGWEDNKAFMRVNGSLAYHFAYAYKYRSADGLDNVILATARPIGCTDRARKLGLSGSSRTGRRSHSCPSLR